MLDENKGNEKTPEENAAIFQGMIEMVSEHKEKSQNG